jgi:hypothetical protein
MICAQRAAVAVRGGGAIGQRDRLGLTSVGVADQEGRQVVAAQFLVGAAGVVQVAEVRRAGGGLVVEGPGRGRWSGGWRVGVGAWSGCEGVGDAVERVGAGCEGVGDPVDGAPW